MPVKAILLLNFAIIFPVFLAFMYRARGGAIPLSDTTQARAFFWVFPNALIGGFCLPLHLPYWWLAFLYVGAIYGGICIGHSKWQNNDIDEFWGMTWITWARMAMIMLPAAIFLHWQYMLITAVAWLTWVACYCGWRTNFAQTQTFRLFGVTWCAPGGSEWEELFVGSVWGVMWCCVYAMDVYYGW